MPSTRLILVRHGQTACNVAEIWHGWDDCALTATGLAQARAVGRRLAGEPIVAVYSSDSRRAMQTAEAIAAHHGVTPVATEALRERHAGEYEGLHIDAILQRAPHIWEERDADVWNWAPPGGETYRQVLDRAVPVVRAMVAGHPGETVVAVSHMSTVRTLVSALAGMPMLETYAQEFASTGVTILRLEAGGVTVETLNDDTHLPT